MVSWEKAECRVTDLIQPLTIHLSCWIRRPRGDVGGNRSASPEPLYDSELRSFVVMVGRLGWFVLLCVRHVLHQRGDAQQGNVNGCGVVSGPIPATRKTAQPGSRIKRFGSQEQGKHRC